MLCTQVLLLALCSQQHSVGPFITFIPFFFSPKLLLSRIHKYIIV